MWGRIAALVAKEFWAVLRDPRSRLVLIVPPIMQLLVFSFASTLEIRNFDVGVLNRDGGRAGAEIMQRLAGSPNVGRIVRLESEADARDAIERQRVLAALEIGPTLSADVAAGRPSTVLAVRDGRRSNAAQIVAGYLTRIVAEAEPGAGVATRAASPSVRHMFNPNLDYLWFTVPSLIAIIGAISTLMVTGQSVARERELGTFEQLMVSPLRVHEILIGKTVPPIALGLLNSSIFILAAVFAFGVPLGGSVLLLYLALLAFLLSVTGVGLFVSSLAQTQQQAFLGVFTFLVPAVLLSGYAAPIDNMPGWLQAASLANPLRHILVVTQGIFLKAMPAAVVMANVLPLLAIGAVTLTAAGWLFRKRME